MIDPSAFGNTNVPSPAQDELEARRLSVPAIAPFPKSPAIPRIKPTPQAGGDTGGGGTDLNSLMPLLLLAAAPFIEGSHPGYGLGIVHGVQQYQAQQSQDRSNEILGMIQHGGNLTEEQLPIYEATLKAAGVKPDRIKAIVTGIRGGLGRSPDWEMQQALMKLHKTFAPQFAEAAATGQPFDPTQLTPEQFRPAQGLLPTYGVHTITPAVPAQPGSGELGTRTPPVAAQPAVERVERRGQQDLPTVGQLFPKAQGTPFAAVPIQPNQMGTWLGHAKELGWITTPAEEAAHKKDYQVFLRGKLEDAIRNPGSHDLATLKAQMESPEAGMNFSTEVMKARDVAAKAESALPKPESYVLLNTRTGETQNIQLPPGTKLHTFSPPNAPQQHLILYPDGRRELLPPGMVPTHAPTPPSPDKVSPADKEVLGIFFDANKYAQLKTRPQAEQDAFAKRFQEAIKNIGVKVPTGPLPPPTDPFWDAIKSWVLQRLGVGEPAPAPGVPRPVAPKPKSPADDPLGILTP